MEDVHSKQFNCPIEFDLKLEPTDLKRISNWPLGMGYFMVIVLVGLFFLSEFAVVEIIVFFFEDYMAEFVKHLFLLGVIFLSTAYILRFLSWRKGSLKIDDDRLVINGSKEFYLKYDGVSRLKYRKFKTLEIRTRYYPVRIRFKNRDQYMYIGQLLEKKNRQMMYNS